MSYLVGQHPGFTGAWAGYNQKIGPCVPDGLVLLIVKKHTHIVPENEIVAGIRHGRQTGFGTEKKRR